MIRYLTLKTHLRVMAKAITGGAIFTVIVLIVLFTSLPGGDVVDSKSAATSAQQNIATDTVVKTGGAVINTLGDQAINSSCKDAASQACSTVTTTVNMAGIAITVLAATLIVSGILGAVKFVMNVVENF